MSEGQKERRGREALYLRKHELEFINDMAAGLASLHGEERGDSALRQDFKQTTLR